MKCANDEHVPPSDGPIHLHEACHEKKNSAGMSLTRVLGLGPLSTTFSQLPLVSMMATNSQRPKERDGVLSVLNVKFTEVSNLVKGTSSITPAKAVFGSCAVILTTIRVRFFLFCVTPSLRSTYVQESLANEQDYVDLGLNCGEICKVLDRGTKGREMEGLSQSVREAINQLTACVKPTICGLDG